MSKPLGFIPPPAGEPVPHPPPAGATDAGLGGVEVPPEDMDDAERAMVDALLAPAAVTWSAVLSKARSYLGAYPPARRRENVNDFTVAYYGTTSTAAAWCFIFIWYVLNSLGAAGLIGGKQAYVPWMNRITGFRSGSSGMKVGAIVGIAGFSHIGFCVAVGGSTFDLLSGNSTSGGSSDAITVKRYDKAVISGHVNLAYATAPGPAPSPTSDDVVAMVIM
jgi:hypothetical protein